MKKYILVLLGLFMATSYQILQAQTDTTTKSFDEMSLDQLMNIEVSVSSTESQTVFSTPSTVTVIDRDLINQYNFQTVAEAVRNIAGVDIYFTNLDNNVPTIRGILQNFYANKILVMINNIPTWQPIYGNTQLDRIDINDVERIEVLRGPASVLYGSNAYTGVINIVLHNKSKHETNTTEVNAKIQLGYPKTGNAGANIVLTRNDFRFFISGNSNTFVSKPFNIQSQRGQTFTPMNPVVFRTDSDYLYNQQLSNYSFNIAAEYKSHSLYMNTYTYMHSTPGVAPSYKSGGGTLTTHEGILINYNYDKKLANDKVRLIGNLTYDFYSRNWPDSYDRITALELAAERWVAGLRSNINITNEINAEIGIDAENRVGLQHIQKNMATGEIVRINMSADDVFEWSGFAQIGYNHPLFNILAGTRYTNNNLFGGNLSSRVTGVVKINETNSVKLIFGQSFRTPTMLELYFNHPTVVGYLDLKPELHTSYELAYITGINKFLLQINGYYGEYKELIQRVRPDPTLPATYRNVSSFKGYGAEFELRYKNPGVANAFISYNFMKGVGDDAKSNYQYIPQNTIRLGINKPIQKFFISVNTYIASQIKFEKIVNNIKLRDVKIDSQYFLDINAGYNHLVSNFNITHTVGVKNLTGNEMLTPEYIRNTVNIDALATMGWGATILYTLSINF